MGCGPSKGAGNAKNGQTAATNDREPQRRKTDRRSDGRKTAHRGYRSLEEVEQHITAILQGELDIECPSNARVVRIFTSSTFTDTVHERNALMERVYPRLKKFCQERGYEFQVVDMRWGIRDEATDDHMGTELCLREIEACQKLSSGPNFVTFLSQRYGTRLLPRKIEADEFESMVSGIVVDEEKTLLQSWYKKDENEIPAIYVLQRISTILPDYKSTDEEVKRQAKASWWSVSDRIRKFLSQASEKIFKGDSRANKYKYSVTEHEVVKGIMETGNPDKSCVWFHRVLKNVDQQQNDEQLLARFVEGDDSDDDAGELLETLKKDKILVKIPRKSVFTYDVNWTEKGIDPMNVVEHRKYIENLCEDFENHIKAGVLDGIAERAKSDITDPLYEEVSQHVTFCQNKCEMFQGRQNTLREIERYLNSDAKSPLILHGVSGCGKTSVVAMAAKMVRKVISKDTVVILRFLGTTPDSCNVRRLLFSICRQISKAYGDDEPTPDALKMLTRILPERLGKASKERPLVLLLDSLDQLDDEGDAHQLSWLPLDLPDHVKLVASTLPDKQYECYPILKTILSHDNFIDVPALEESDASNILHKWLDLQNRRLTTAQMQRIVTACQNCPLPLFLKISFDEACRWHSFSEPEETLLESNVRDAITALFQRVEMLYGKMLVSRALGYLTAGKNGLTENELEDILSLDDDVLNDVYQYWTPPIRRLPPLLWVRIRAELSPYLVERGADGARVTSWYHRQFKEAARDRYLADERTRRLLHSNIGDFFLGIWSDGKKKPYTTKSGVKGESDRLVASQPLVFGENSFNLRKLSELPYHLMESEKLALLKEHVILNLDWLYTKIKATSLRHVFDDFRAAAAQYPDDHDVSTVAELLQLSQEGLEIDPNQLSGQILARIVQDDMLKSLVSQAQSPKFTSLLPSFPFLTPPGGPLLRTVAGHKDNMIGLDISWDGKLALTGGADNSIKLWDVESGYLLKTLENVGKDVNELKFCNGDKNFAVSCEGRILLYRTSNASLISQFRPDGLSSTASVSFAVGGENGEILFVPCLGRLKALDLFSDSVVKEVVDEFLEEKHWTCFVQAKRYTVAYFNKMIGRKMNLLQVVDMATDSPVVRTIEPYPKTKTPGGVFQIQPVTALAITDCRIIVSNIKENGLKLYDLKTLQFVKFIEGNKNDMSARFHLTADCKYILFPNKGRVCVWDLENERRSNILEHPFPIYNTASVDAKKIVTIGIDNLIRIWDASRDDPRARLVRRDWNSYRSADKPTSKDDGNLEVTEKENFADLWTIPGNKRDLIACCKQGSGDLCSVTVWDTVDARPKTRIVVESSERLRWTILDQKLAVGIAGQRIKVINYAEGKMVRVFKGHTGGEWLCLVNKRQEIVAITKGGRNLKVLDVETGEAVAMLKHSGKESRNSTPVWYFMSNPDGHGSAVASMLEGDHLTWYIWDVPSRSLRHTLTAPGKSDKASMTVADSVFTANCRYFCCKYKESPEVNSDLAVWDLDTGKVAHRLFHDRGGSVTSVVAMGDDKILVSYCEKSIDILLWSLPQGEQLLRLPGHSNRYVDRLLLTEDERHLVSYQSLSAKEREFILWDLVAGKKVAGFTVEENSIIQLACQGNIITVGARSIGSIVTFSLTGSDVIRSELSSYAGSSQTTTASEVYLDLIDPENDNKTDLDDIDSDFDDDEV